MKNEKNSNRVVIKIVIDRNKVVSCRVANMKTEIKISGRIYKIEVFEIRENLIQVLVNEKPYFFTQDEFGRLVKAEKEKLLPFSFEEGEGVRDISGEKEIKSPIAGTVSAILVKVGEEVKPNRKVLTLISMKMENEIISESAGEVDEIRIKENQFVNAGEVLITLK